MTASRWAVVLAGGEGERMKSFVQRWIGSSRPKQYCAFSGDRTMLDATYERALRVVAPEKIVTVIGKGHARYLQAPAPGALLVQPENKDTAPGVLLPLSAVLARDPEAVVAILPSDHHFENDERLASYLEEGFRLAERLPGQLVLLAARPTGPEPDLGWIGSGGLLPFGSARLVTGFREKPAAEEAERLHGAGWLWNTMILVARAGALWDLAGAVQPDLLRRFAALRAWHGLPEAAEAVELAYRSMPAVNLSRDILERLADWAVVLAMDGVGWSDWGRPERVVRSLPTLGLAPAPLRAAHARA